MLGIIHDKWDKRESVHVNKGDKFVIIRGRRVEVKLEDNNKLRLSVVEKVDNREVQYHEAVLNITNLLEKHRKDLAKIKLELVDMISKLDSEDLAEEVEDDLYREVRAKRAIKKNHEKEISKLLAKTYVKVNYRIGRTGLTAVLPPGLTLQPKFVPEPICWCPYNMPASSLVEEITAMVEERPIEIFTAKGTGLISCIPNEEAKFAITSKGINGKLVDASVDDFAVESKEVEMKSTVLNKTYGWNVSYSAGDVKKLSRFSLDVTYRNRHIRGSPFSVSIAPLLLEFSSAVNHTKDWLDDAVKKLSSISRAVLSVQLHDLNGSEIYKSSGVTSCKWTKNHITAPGSLESFDDAHSNAIILENGDRMMIVGKNGTRIFEELRYHMGGRYGNGYNAYRSYNIIINKKQDCYWNPTRRMIIAIKAPEVPGWTAVDNRISFSRSGFKAQNGNWPKFRGTFRIYYMPLQK